MDNIKKKEQESHSHTHDHEHSHNHAHGHCHNHDHGKLPVVLYFVGLALAIIALFVNNNDTLQNILFSLSTLAAGYHVVVLESINETVENTKRFKKFTPNSHILMGLAAIGTSFLGDFMEGTLLILIFSGAHFLEEYAEGKSKREISNLLEMNTTKARLMKQQGEKKTVDH